jgi:hypothetical protein
VARVSVSESERLWLQVGVAPTVRDIPDEHTPASLVWWHLEVFRSL